MNLGFYGHRKSGIPCTTTIRSTRFSDYPSSQANETSKRVKVRSRKFTLPHPACSRQLLIDGAAAAATNRLSQEQKRFSLTRTSVKSQQMELLQTHFSLNCSIFKSDCVSGYLDSFPALKLLKILCSRGGEKDAAKIQPKTQLQDQRRKNWMPNITS